MNADETFDLAAMRWEIEADERLAARRRGTRHSEHLSQEEIDRLWCDRQPPSPGDENP